MKGAPNLHATIVNAPEFYRLKQICRECACGIGGSIAGARGVPSDSESSERGGRAVLLMVPAPPDHHAILYGRTLISLP